MIKNKKEYLLCFFISVLFASTIYVYLCERNISELESKWVIFAGLLIVALIAGLSFFLSSLLIRPAFSSMVFCLVAWIGCYTQPLICDNLLFPLKERIGLTGCAVIAGAVFIILGLIISFFAKTIKNPQRMENLIAAVFSAVFLINFIPLVFHCVSSKTITDASIPMKNDFTIDSDCAHPDIYWIHPDGMLGFSSFSKYFNDDQNEFKNELESRGFAINPNAAFEAAHTTAIAIPALMSPYGYDNWIRQKLKDNKSALRLKQDPSFLQTVHEYRKNNEMVKAFADAGYFVSVIGSVRYYYPPDGGDFYVYNSRSSEKYVTHTNQRVIEALEAEDTIATLGRISAYLNIVFKALDEYVYKEFIYNDIISNSSEVYSMESAGQTFYGSDKKIEDNIDNFIFSALRRVLLREDTRPKITIVQDYTPHFPYKYDEDGNLLNESMDPGDYYSQHIWSEKVLLTMIDTILDANPSAVIVVQSDHGLHGNTEKEFIDAFGENTDAADLWNNTISAIRVPDEYSFGEEEYIYNSPLNISRWLINNYVGRNYDYIQP